MLRNQNIICISSIDWDFIWQQHQAIMSILAKNKNRILFIENTGVRAINMKDLQRLKKRFMNWRRSIGGFREEMENLYIYSPLILPFPYFKIARWINKHSLLKAITRWMKVMEFNNPIIWTFLPTPIVLDLVEEIPHKAFVYYCTDNFAATSKSAQKVVKYEKKVIQKADAVFVMARNLLDYCLSFNTNVTCIPMGVETEIFMKANTINIKPVEIRDVNCRIIGFVGGMRQTLDQALLQYLAKRLSDFTFVFVGPIQAEISCIKQLKNIIFVGQKPHDDLPRYIKYFDVCIIPYKKDNYTDNISPAKLNEYLIMGKPVVSTSLKEIVNFNKENDNILYIANDHADFANLILEAMKQDSEILRNKRIEIARNNSWEKKIEQMSEIVEAVIKEKEKEIVSIWQKRLTEVYRLIRRKAYRFIFAFSVILLLIFYTPLLWFLAEPLKIVDNPKKTDVIVVFAGGVGESGKAGQGYEERVQHAVDLYKQGFAKNIIFSSGYIYVFKEPQVMKVLAVSLGVPENAIVLEDRAKNTYENVKFTKEILDTNGWIKALLVSSPYHMRRASLVFNKVAKEIEVYYTPIPKSIFYSHETRDSYGRKIWKRINFEQIKGIFHEYLGILYYWWKRYI